MAVRARSGVTGYAVGLVIFVILTVIGLILSILFYTEADKARADKDQSDKALAVYVDRENRSKPEVLALEAVAQQESKSVVQLLLDEVQALRVIVIGDRDATKPTIDDALAKANLQTGKLISEVQNAREVIKARDRDIARLNEQIVALNKDVAAAVAGREALGQSYDQGVSAVKTQLTGVQSDAQAFEGNQKRQLAELQARLAELQAQKAKAEADHRAKVEELTAEIERLKKALDDLRLPGKEGTAVDRVMTAQPDGSIVSVSTEDNVVYINRGRADRVMLGMTFEVFTRATGVVVDDLGLRGKGTVEIVSIGENSCSARVVRLSRGQTVVPGDLVANIAYDPNATLKFYVFGEFDIDNTGQATETDRRRVEAMIAKWGGVVVSDLTYDTDFLVLGKEPGLPEPPRDAIDPEQVAKFEREKQLFNTYQQLIGEARKTSIPVLNQNRFLALIGYYQR